MTVFVYVNTAKQVGDKDHIKLFANLDAAEKCCPLPDFREFRGSAAQPHPRRKPARATRSRSTAADITPSAEGGFGSPRGGRGPDRYRRTYNVSHTIFAPLSEAPKAVDRG
jgi:hypothetical protein